MAKTQVTGCTPCLGLIVSHQPSPPQLARSWMLHHVNASPEMRTITISMTQLLDDEYTGCDKAELVADGWTPTGTLNVETGEFNLIEA